MNAFVAKGVLFSLCLAGLACGLPSARADEERLEDCVGALPESMFQSDKFKEYRLVTKNKFKTVESGVTENGRKVVLTSSRCTRNIRSFSFEFPKGHALNDSAYWLKQAADALRQLKVKAAFRRPNAKVIATLKEKAADRTPASVSSDGKKWEKPLDMTVQENYETVHFYVERRGAKVSVTVADDTSM